MKEMLNDQINQNFLSNDKLNCNSIHLEMIH